MAAVRQRICGMLRYCLRIGLINIRDLEDVLWTHRMSGLEFESVLSLSTEGAFPVERVDIPVEIRREGF